MRINRGYLNWGIFFVCLGGVPLLVQQGLIATSAAGDLWRLWPVILVGLGLGMILSRTPAYFFGGMVVAACLGLAFGGMIATGTNISCGSMGAGGTSIDRSGTFADSGSIDLHIVCGSMTVSSADGNGWQVRAANERSDPANVNASASALSVESTSASGVWIDRGKDTWTIALPRTPQLTVSMTLDAADSRLDLSGSNVASLQSTLNFGSTTIDLTGARAANVGGTLNFGSAKITLPSNDTNVSYTVNFGSLELCVPADVGVQLRSKETLSGSNLASAGYTRSGDADTWVSPGAASQPHHATIDITTNLGSLNVHPVGGCK